MSYFVVCYVYSFLLVIDLIILFFLWKVSYSFLCCGYFIVVYFSFVLLFFTFVLFHSILDEILVSNASFIFFNFLQLVVSSVFSFIVKEFFFLNSGGDDDDDDNDNNVSGYTNIFLKKKIKGWLYIVLHFSKP